LLRNVADMSWDQAITMEEFAEPMCFTTHAHRDAVNTMLEGKPGSAQIKRHHPSGTCPG
jgi:2-(1,2-epoxy-1,2-dihydrophenyl)acetyl-CoA isomerase